MPHTFMLDYKNVNPQIDVDMIHEAFDQAGMDVLVGCGCLEEGFLGLDVTVEGLSALEGLTKALCVAHQVVEGGKLLRAGPELVGLTEIAVLTEITREELRPYLHQPWFPKPVNDKGEYRLDEVVQALLDHTPIRPDDAQSLMECAPAARAVNENLASQRR